MKRKIILRLSFLIAFLTLLWSCRNEDFVQAEKNPQRNNRDFFKHSKKGGASSKTSADYVDILEAYNREKNFLSAMPDQEGMPIWDKMRIVKTENSTSLIIPLSEDNATMSSVFFALIDNKENTVKAINNITNDELRRVVFDPSIDVQKRESLFYTFMATDNYTFGNEVFTNIPQDLFVDDKLGEQNNRIVFHAPRVGDALATEATAQNGRVQVVYEVICVVIRHCTHHGGGSCDGCSQCKTESCSHSTTLVFTYPDPETGVVIYGYPEGGGGGGTPLPIPDPDPCGLSRAFYRVAQSCTGTDNPTTALEPCEILKRNSARPKFKAKLDSLKYLVSPSNPAQNNYETQVTVQVTSSTKVQYNVSNQAINTGAGTMSVVGQGTNYDIATMHNHTSGYIPIFSASDVVSFYAKYKFVEPVYQERYIYYVTCSNGTTYAIKIDDPSALDTLFSVYNLENKEQKAQADDDIKKIFEDSGGMNTSINYTAEMAEKMFLKTMNSQAFGNGNSISLYQYEGNKWKKLALDLNENLLKEPCPL